MDFNNLNISSAFVLMAAYCQVPNGAVETYVMFAKVKYTSKTVKDDGTEINVVH